MSQLHFVGLSLDEARLFIESIVIACLKNCFPAPKVTEAPLSIRDACKFLGVSKPTLRKYVEAAVVRRHDLGPRKKVFYRSELEEDIKRLRSHGSESPLLESEKQRL